MPQTVFDQGDPITSRFKLGVTPDGTTTVSVQWLNPDNTTGTGSAPESVAVDEWISQLAATGTQAGDYVAIWTVTGTGASKAAKVYNVRALPGGRTRVVWSPFLSQVADYVPRLTVDTVTPGSAIPLGTFTGRTDPTDEQVQRLIDQAVARIAAPLITVAPALYDLATTVAALRAAASVQRAYARNAQDYGAASSLDEQADAAYKSLVTANASATEPGGQAMPEWSFPSPSPWGDGVPRDAERLVASWRWGEDLL